VNESDTVVSKIDSVVSEIDTLVSKIDTVGVMGSNKKKPICRQPLDFTVTMTLTTLGHKSFYYVQNMLT